MLQVSFEFFERAMRRRWGGGGDCFRLEHSPNGESKRNRNFLFCCLTLSHLYDLNKCANLFHPADQIGVKLQQNPGRQLTYSIFFIFLGMVIYLSYGIRYSTQKEEIVGYNGASYMELTNLADEN